MILLCTLLLMSIAADDPPAEEPVVIVDGYGNPRPPKTPRRAKRSPSRATARCPARMSHVAGGTYFKKPIPEFCLDTYEVTITEFDAYVRALDLRPDVSPARRKALRSALKQVEWPGLAPAEAGERDAACTWHDVGKNPDLPINCVSHAEAEAYCASLGKRLPSEREWQWAARGGPKGWHYPWGDGKPTRERVNMARDDTPNLVPVGDYVVGAFGLYDMAGNVWEWTAGDPAQAGCHARGGSYRSKDPRHVKATSVLPVADRRYRSDEIGFRCAATVHSANPTP